MKITSELGTDLTVPMEGAQVIYAEKHLHGIFPGCASITNPSWVAEGTVVVDGSNQITGPVEEPINMIIEKGRITEILGGKQAKRLAAHIKSYDDPNAYLCPAHVCVGLNPKLRGRTGNLMEDEHARGVIVLGVGVNKYIPGGDVDARMHTDVSMLTATLTVDGREIVKDGDIVI